MTMQAPTMAERCAAQSVIEELLRLQAAAPRRSTIGRFFGSSPLGEDSRSWYDGATGEIAVGKILATLPAGWRVFHALPVGTKGADVDHLVLGPGGIFTINTKHHSDRSIWVAGSTFMVSGRVVPYLPSAEFEARRVSALLRERMPRGPAEGRAEGRADGPADGRAEGLADGPADGSRDGSVDGLIRDSRIEVAHVTPVIALVDPRSLRIKRKPKSVVVVEAHALRRWLLKRPSILLTPDLTRLASIIDDPATWSMPVADSAAGSAHTSGSASASVAELSAGFVALDAEVRDARLRRALWRLIALVVVASAALIAAPTLATALMKFVAGLLQ